MKKVLTIGLIILSLALAGLHLHTELNVRPAELDKRTKIAWYVGCVGSVLASGGTIYPEQARLFCDDGYVQQNFEALSKAIDEQQEVFFLTH